MREIVFDLTEDSYLPKSAFGGFEGEHHATKVTLRLPPRVLHPDGIYYMVFETEADRQVIFSAPLLLQEDSVSVSLPRQVMLSPAVTVHAAVYRKKGEELTEIAKSSRVVLEIRYPESESQKELSEEGGAIPGLVIESELIPDSDRPVSAKALYREFSSLSGEQVESASVNGEGELILKRKNNGRIRAGKVIGPKGDRGEQGERGPQGEKGDRGEADYALVAGALFATEEGRTPSLKDVSPLPHIIDVRLFAKERLAPLDGLNRENLDEAGDYTVTDVAYDAVRGCEVAYLNNGGVLYREEGLQGAVSVGDLIRLEVTEADAALYLVENPDFSAMTVSEYGKNLLPCPYRSGEEATVNGVTFTVNEDGSVTVRGTNTGTGLARFDLTGKLPLDPSCTYTASAKGIQNANLRALNNKRAEFDLSGGGTCSVFTPATNYGEFFIYVKAGVTVSETVYPMLEIGTSETEYEPYREPIAHVPAPDGTVSGIVGKGEGITLLADTDGVTLIAGYNRDLNKVIRRLENALISEGGV